MRGVAARCRFFPRELARGFGQGTIPGLRQLECMGLTSHVDEESTNAAAGSLQNESRNVSENKRVTKI